VCFIQVKEETNWVRERKRLTNSTDRRVLGNVVWLGILMLRTLEPLDNKTGQFKIRVKKKKCISQIKTLCLINMLNFF
jgi:hypothetical protein